MSSESTGDSWQPSLFRAGATNRPTGRSMSPTDSSCSSASASQVVAIDAARPSARTPGSRCRPLRPHPDPRGATALLPDVVVLPVARGSTGTASRRLNPPLGPGASQHLLPRSPARRRAHLPATSARWYGADQEREVPRATDEGLHHAHRRCAAGRRRQSSAMHFAFRDRRRYPDVSGDGKRSNGPLTDALDVMTAGGPDADQTTARSLDERRGDEDFAILVLRTLDAVEESAYLERWALLQLAIDLQHPATGDYLADFVRRPIPEEKAEDPVHGVSTVTEESSSGRPPSRVSRLFRRDVDSADGAARGCRILRLRRDAPSRLSSRWSTAVRDDGLQTRAGNSSTTETTAGSPTCAALPVQEAEQQDPANCIDPDPDHGMATSQTPTTRDPETRTMMPSATRRYPTKLRLG